jgi:hypothetical protein
VIDRDPVEDAFRALRQVSPRPDLAGRIKAGLGPTVPLSGRSARRRSGLVAGFLAATFLVAVVWISLPVQGRIAQPPPDRARSAVTVELRSPEHGSSLPMASRAPAGLGPDALVRALREFSLGPGLVVEPGQSLLVVAGPTDDGGVDSYLLQHFGDLNAGYRPGGVTGWVPATQIDGLVSERSPICPSRTDLRSVAALQPFEQMRCFGWPRELTFEPVTARQRIHGGHVSNTWISDDGRPDFFTGLPVYGLTPQLALPESGWFRVTGHFDDPAAIECGEPAEVAWCRERFIVTAVSPVDPPDIVLTGTWKPTAEAPIDGRTQHGLVWTGSEVVVWGGTSSSDDPGQSVFEGITPRDGAAYEPVADRWRLIPNAPIPGRNGPVIAWTGSEVLVFGGRAGEATRVDGAAWSPTTNAWRTIARAPLDGDETVGGWLNGRLVIVTSTSAASYDPATDRWNALPPAPIRPGWRTAVVAGNRLFVVAFGDGASLPVDWAVLDLTTSTWRHGAVPIDPLMAGTTFVGAGDRVVVLATGQSFDPLTFRWQPASDRCDRAGNGSIWTGRFVVGVTGAWDSVSGVCKDLPPAPRRAPPFDDSAGREFAAAVWTGTQYVTWSGGNGGDIVWVPKDGAVFTPDEDLRP